jgi:hypothetical protein
MIDYYNLADNQYKDQVFTGPIGTSTSSSIFFWIKPRGITMIHITAIGGGGGGGAGNSSAGTAASGGSGGGAGAITRLTIPAIFLPDSLKITVPGGGSGAAAGGSGGNTAGNTFVDCARGSDVAATRIIQANGGQGGNVGVAGGGSTGGAAGGIGLQTNAVYQALGTWVPIAGQIGGAGVNTAAGSAVSVNGSSTTVSGGAAGGGKSAANANFDGGAITGIGLIPTLAGGTGGGAGGTQDGNGGTFSMKGFYSTGGSGGGSVAGGTGGRGGNGNIGSGGGGGGAGTTGGAGGNGGPGMVIITCW